MDKQESLSVQEIESNIMQLVFDEAIIEQENKHEINSTFKERCLTYTNIYGDSIDELILNAINVIQRTGSRINSRAGVALQSYGVNYILTNPRNRIHTLRNGALTYLCREFLAYFNGSLKVSDGLATASKFWLTLADKDGNINSNYGYYIFYEEIKEHQNQFNWVINSLIRNSDSRRAIININQSYHKSNTKDFPCTVSIQFFIKENILHCEVSSRSTDVITELPYDMGFFSFIHELLYQRLREKRLKKLLLGNTVMRTSFTQIYDKTLEKAHAVLTKYNNEHPDNEIIYSNMPKIDNAEVVLSDIYNGTSTSEVMKWIINNAKVNNENRININ